MIKYKYANMLTLKGQGYFTNKKGGVGGGHYGPSVYLGS